jgi:peptide/nickel transport system permease protein
MKFNKKLLLIWVGGFLILFVTTVALLAPVITNEDPNAMLLPKSFEAPSLQSLFGRDDNGTSVLAKVIYGARVSLLVAFTVVGISTIIGLVMGSIAGYFGKWIDTAIMRFIDMLYAFPNFLLALGLVAVLGPSLQNMILAMCLTSWTGYARLVRGEILHLKEKEYVLTAVALGAPAYRVVFRHLWPNLTGPLVVHASFSMAGTIDAESGLSFLGLGAPAEVPTWGALLSSGRRILLEAPHVSIFPGLAIVILVLGFNLFGDGLRDYLDPKKS